MPTRMTKIQTSRATWMSWYLGPAVRGLTASRMKVIRATPVTP